MVVLPTGFGKSIIYQSFDFANTASIVVVVPFRSIFQDQLQSKDFGLKAVAFKIEDPTIIKRHLCQQVQCNFRIRAEQALSAEFTAGCFKMI